MGGVTKEQLQRHIKTHTERSADDRDAIAVLLNRLRSGGRINCSFSDTDKWPNTDGFFELVPDPEATRRPKQNFIVQIKGTNHANVNEDGSITYSLKSLAFPAYIALEVTLDPGILFVVVDAGKRNKSRVFWKYMSPTFLAGINFDNDSSSIKFTRDDEIFDADESVDLFIKKLAQISDNHSFMKQLENREYTLDDIYRIINFRCNNISEAIDEGNILNKSRDNISKKIFTELNDLCVATLILNASRYYEQAGLRTAWEYALTSIDTKFLSIFLQGLKYVGIRVPEEGQFERLILKYYDFLWKIREYLLDYAGLSVLNNLESFPLEINEEDEKYNQIVARGVDNADKNAGIFTVSRYYVQKKNVFYVGPQRYFELTLQLADKFATKFNRLTVYTQIDISTNYSIQIAFVETEIDLWDCPSKIKVITNWRVSIEPSSLNKLARILSREVRISSRYNEYIALMDFLTQTGINLLDFIDMRNERFFQLLNAVYEGQKTKYYYDVLESLHQFFNSKSQIFGKNTVRYILIRMKEEIIENVSLEVGGKQLTRDALKLSSRCYPFESNPALYNLPYSKTNKNSISIDVIRAVGSEEIKKYIPYIRAKHLINKTGELFFPRSQVELSECDQTIAEYNAALESWDIRHGAQLLEQEGYIYLKEYVDDTISILHKLQQFSETGNEGQRQLNQNYTKNLDRECIDESKIRVLNNVFVDSRIIMIYGAAGTGKTTLMNHLSTLMSGRSKLFLTKTHTALENLKRRVDSPGQNSAFMGIDRYLRIKDIPDYDLIFVDECSTIDNKTMLHLLEKINDTSLLICTGDIYQIESIDFGNWFYYSRDILPEKSVAELNFNWRTQDESIKGLWEEVRYKKPLITERLVIDGPFSESISKHIFESSDPDEVVLCLNYDGKFGLNNINSYFQDANTISESFSWHEWKYKVGDPILFNESKRFPQLYNNLKGRIVDIEPGENDITFTIDADIILTALDAKGSDFKIVSFGENTTRICFTIYDDDGGTTDEERELARMKSIIPFQLAYAVSIHKAQGLEYSSVKIVIPNSNSERITHGIFYTAITRTKGRLKIYWSSDTMKKVISGFNEDSVEHVSLELIKARLSE